MEENNDSVFSVESIGFIFRHPWMIACTFLIIFNAIQSCLSAIPPKYLSAFNISFEAPSGSSPNRNFTAERKAAVEKAVSGESLRHAVKAAVEGLGEKERSVQYDQLMESIVNKDPGLRYEWVEASDRVKLSLGILLKDPKVGYRLIKALMEGIMAESAESMGKKMEGEIKLLENQLARYKEKRETSSLEIADIRNDLMKRFPELSEAERALVRKMIEEKASAGNAGIEKFSAQDEQLSGLNTELADLQSKKADITQALEAGTYLAPLTAEQVYKEDLQMIEYTKSIAAKELEITALSTRGYKKEHPHVKVLEGEVAKLKEAKRARMESLKESASGGIEDEGSKEKARAEIEEINFKIEFIRRKISQQERARALIGGRIKAGEAGDSDVGAKVAKVVELKRESVLIDTYYQDTRKKLEDARVRYDIIREGGGVKIVVLKNPEIPAKPQSSNEAVNMTLVGFIMALAAGMGIAFFVDKLNSPVRSGKELIGRYALPVVGTIDRVVAKEGKRAASNRRKAMIAGTIIVMIITRVLVRVLAPLFFNA